MLMLQGLPVVSSEFYESACNMIHSMKHCNDGQNKCRSILSDVISLNVISAFVIMGLVMILLHRNRSCSGTLVYVQ